MEEEQHNRSAREDKYDQQGPQKKVGLPKYNDGLGKLFELPDRPQSDFDGVVTEVYPLRADLKRLQSFCDGYLNADAENQPVLFEAMAPWVLLHVSKYGKIAFHEQNRGWVSQHELAFGFPVRVFERDDLNQRRFKDWAMVYPFIYVDNPLSMSLGRQVYGWGKAEMELLPPHPDPEPHTRCLLSVDLTEGPERQAARAKGAPRFLEIFQQGSALSGNAGFASLYSLFPRALQSSLQTVSGFLGAVSGFWSGVQDSSDVNDFPDPFFARLRNMAAFFSQLQNMASQSFGAFDYLERYLSAAAEMSRDLGLMNPGRKYDLGQLNIVTLKQFRDAEDTEQACLRALVMSHIEFRRILDGGMLRTDLISPDLTGGIQIKVHESGHDKVVRDLGIKHDHKDASGYVLRPYSPFWLKSHLSYGAADRQYWRTREIPWSTSDGQASEPLEEPKHLDYIEKGSGAQQEIPGAIRSEDFAYQVFALPAKKNDLDKLLEEYLVEPLGRSELKFEVRTTKKMPDHPDEYFILAVFSSNVVTGKDPRKKVADRVVTFALPVSCTLENMENKRESKRRALIPLYTLVEEDWDLATQSEIYGQLVFKSLIKGIVPSWIERGNLKLQVLHAHTFLFPMLDKAEPARFLPLVQVNSVAPVFEVSEDEQPPMEDSDLSQRTLAYLELLGINRSKDRRIRYVALKQIRDAVHFEHANYQALVGVTSQVNQVPKPQDEPSIDILIYGYPDKFDLTRRMGLDWKGTVYEAEDLKITQYTSPTLEGIRFQGKKEERIGENLAWSIRSNDWYLRRPEPRFFTEPE